MRFDAILFPIVDYSTDAVGVEIVVGIEKEHKITAGNLETTIIAG